MNNNIINEFINALESEKELNEFLDKINILDVKNKIKTINQMYTNSKLYNSICAYLLKDNSGNRDDRLCKWLYDIYCTSKQNYITDSSKNIKFYEINLSDGHEWLQLFVIQFIPILVWSLLHRQRLMEESSGIAACLLAIYNKEVELEKQYHDDDDDDVNNIETTLRHTNKKTIHHPLFPLYDIPDGDIISLYKHDDSMTEKKLTVSVLRNFDEKLEHKSNQQKTITPIQSITQHSALKLVHICLRKYNSIISVIPKHSHKLFCAVVSKLTHIHIGHNPFQIYEKDFQLPWGDEHNPGQINISCEVLIELTIGISYCVSYPWTRKMAEIALKLIHSRATQNLQPEVLLYTTSLFELIEGSDGHSFANSIVKISDRPQRLVDGMKMHSK